MVLHLTVGSARDAIVPGAEFALFFRGKQKN